MKQWFPFTDYDFYAYLTTGLFLLLGIDLAVTGGAIMLRTEWPIVHIVLVVAAAYIVGQLCAGPSSAILEHVVARRVLHPPAALLLGFAAPRARERFMAALFVGRNYGPFSPGMLAAIRAKAAKALGQDDATDVEDVFGVAFPVARGVPDAVARMDQFRNLYGFARNVSFSCLLCAISVAIRMLLQPVPYGWWVVAAAFVVSVGMFGRFLKFYAEFAAEVLRTFNHKS